MQKTCDLNVNVYHDGGGANHGPPGKDQLRNFEVYIIILSS